VKFHEPVILNTPNAIINQPRRFTASGLTKNLKTGVLIPLRLNYPRDSLQPKLSKLDMKRNSSIRFRAISSSTFSDDSGLKAPAVRIRGSLVPQFQLLPKTTTSKVEIFSRA
jgi:hypothetical protein